MKRTRKKVSKQRPVIQPAGKRPAQAGTAVSDTALTEIPSGTTTGQEAALPRGDVNPAAQAAADRPEVQKPPVSSASTGDASAHSGTDAGKSPSNAGIYFFRCVFGIALVLSCLLLALRLFSNQIAVWCMHDVSADTGWHLEADSAQIEYFPPSLAVKHLSVKNADFSVSATVVRVRPSLRALLHGKFEPSFIELTEPAFTGHMQQNVLALADTTGNEATPQFDISALLPRGCRMKLIEGNCFITDITDSRFQLFGLTADMRLTDKGTGLLKGSISMDAFKWNNKGRSLTVRDMTLQGKAHLRHPLTAFDCSISARTSLPWLSTHVRISAAVSGTPRGIAADGSLQGNYYFDAQAIPFDITGSVAPVSRKTGPEEDESGAALPYGDLLPLPLQDKDLRLLLRNVAMGDDSCAIDAILRLGEDPSLTGTLRLTRCSLTRWLGFARDLCPGLQIALDEITEGILDFIITKDGLDVPRITAQSCGSVFKGHGGVPSWKKPAVVLDLKAPYVNLGEAIPESVGTIVPEPVYGHRALTEMTWADFNGTMPDESPQDTVPASDAAPATAPATTQDSARQAAAGTPAADTATTVSAQNEAGADTPAQDDAPLEIGYDIRLGGRQVHYGYADFTNGLCVITPTAPNAEGVRDCRLDATGKVFGGNIVGWCIIGGTTELPTYDMHARASGVSSAKLNAAMDFIPFPQGTLNGGGDVIAEGKEIARFLDTMHGKMTVTSSKGSLQLKNSQPLKFDMLTGSLDLNRAFFRQGALGFDGRWKSVLSSDSWSSTIETAGPVAFGGQGKEKGVLLKSLPARITLQGVGSLFKLPVRNAQAYFKGDVSYCSWKQLIESSKASVTLPGIKVNGSASILIQPSQLQYTVTARESTTDVPAVMKGLFNKVADVPAPLRIITGSCRLEGRGAANELSSINALVDGTAIKGQLLVDFAGAKPDLICQLSTPLLNLDTYLDDKKKPDAGTHKHADAQAKPLSTWEGRGKDWDLSFLKTFSLRGTLSADTLIANKVRIHPFSCQIKLYDGKLTASNIEGRSYGGYLKGSGTALFGPGVTFDSSLSLQSFDINPLLKDQKIKSIVTGKANMSSQLTATLTRAGQMPARLSGHVTFMTNENGSFQAVNDQGEKDGAPIRFSSFSSSGLIDKGIINTKNIELTTDTMHVSGSGTFNLVKKYMDCRLSADITGLPMVPVHVSGPFSHSKTSINGGMVVVNAVASIIKSPFTLIEGIFGLFNSSSKKPAKPSPTPPAPEDTGGVIIH